jgi:hypothetical protein
VESVRTLNKLLKENGRSDDTEVTRFKGKYHLLHICKNGVPVPLIISKDISEIKEHMEIYGIVKEKEVKREENRH